MEYLVTWRINIEAETPEEAARVALRIQRDVGSLATVFEVLEDGTNQDPHIIDPMGG